MQNKNLIENVIVYSRIVMLRFDEADNCTFDGNLSVCLAFHKKISKLICFLINYFRSCLFHF